MKAVSGALMDRIEAILLKAAMAGEPCPSNSTIANEVGCNLSCSETSVRRLAMAGRISITRPSRVVRIITVGEHTTAPTAVHPTQISYTHGPKLGKVGTTPEEGSEALRRAIARYHVRRGRTHWEALAAWPITTKGTSI